MHSSGLVATHLTVVHKIIGYGFKCGKFVGLLQKPLQYTALGTSFTPLVPWYSEYQFMGRALVLNADSWCGQQQPTGAHTAKDMV